MFTQPGAPPPSQAVGYTYNNVSWYPSVTGATFYDDNVFARNTNRQGDWAAVVRPELAWRTNNWANMEAAGTAFVEKRGTTASAARINSTAASSSAARRGPARTRRW